MRSLRALHDVIEPIQLNGLAALAAAENTWLTVRPRERHTEFVKRIVCAYLNSCILLGAEPIRKLHDEK